MIKRQLPESWAHPKLGELAEIVSGIGFPKTYQGQSRGDIGFFKVGDISSAVQSNKGLLEHAEHYVSNEVAEILRGKLIESGATVFAKIGEAIRLNRRAIVHHACLIDNNVMAVKARCGALDKYIYYFLRTVDFSEQARSTTVPSLRKGDVENLTIPLAPLAEQKHIADKLDSLLSRVDACRERLDRVPLIIKRFRQSVLAAATSGALTEDWRAGRRLKAKYPLVTLPEVAASRLGKMLDKAKNTGVLRPYLRNVNVRWFDFELNDIQEMKVENDDVNDLLVQKGDLLICEGGEPGRCAVWQGEDDQYIFQKALHRVRPHKEKLNAFWLSYCLKHAADSRVLDSLFTGTTIRHFTGVSLEKFEFPLPSIAEQNEIVRRIDILFDFADRVESRVAGARDAIDRLTPSLLAKAFRGELVPQDPNDEPAAELLKRLAAIKSEQPEATRTRRAAKARGA